MRIRQLLFFIVALRQSFLMPPAHAYNSVISDFIRTAIFILFASLTRLIMRDDRLIGDCEIKLSPIKAQGPPFLKHLFTAHCLIPCLTQYLYYCSIFAIVQKENHSSFAGILAILKSVNTQFLNLKTQKLKNSKTGKDFIFPFLSFPVFRFFRKGGEKIFLILSADAKFTGSVEVVAEGG